MTIWPSYLWMHAHVHVTSNHIFTFYTHISLLRSPAASGHVQLLVFWSACAIWLLCYVWLWCPEFSTGREEKVDAVITTTRICVSEDFG